MVAGFGSVSLEKIDPHVRPIDAWRDGAAVADLLEMCFKDEGIDDSGQRMIRMLRNYGPLESLMLDGAPGFVWVEDGRVTGNVSVQRNPIRRDTWVIGNVATHPSSRNQGIASALLDTAMNYALTRGARTLALQVVEGNAAAIHLYEKHGFSNNGAVVYYQRPSVRSQPLWHDLASAGTSRVRRAGWSDSESVWKAAQHNIHPALTYAEPFDQHVYRLGLRWTLSNWLNGNCEQWLVAEQGGVFMGAVRTRENVELSEHHLELMLAPQAQEDPGIQLLERALKVFDTCSSKPLLASQARPHAPSHAALQAMGFKPLRTLLHMTHA